MLRRETGPRARMGSQRNETQLLFSVVDTVCLSVSSLDAHKTSGGSDGRESACNEVENLPAMRETWVLSLGWEDPPEEGTATHSTILAWIIPWTQGPGRL